MLDTESLIKELKLKLSSVKSSGEIDELKIKYLGKKGVVNNLLKEIKKITPDKKKEFGLMINNFKSLVGKLIELRFNEILKQTNKETFIDTTLPGIKYPKGSLHIMTLAIEEISSIFEKLGFVRVSYPEIEWEFFAFEALNMPKGHPARDDFETFFIDFPPHKKFGRMVLSPHTSSGQNREMKRVKNPPIRMINIAKTYRPNLDATHVPMFHQFEGLCIDKNINITHLKSTINHFVKEFFGPSREIRLRPCHFQFTEPSFEIDVTCGVCNGKGILNSQKCKTCKSGWLELGGSGMVHPNVLKAGSIDPDKYSGWAFGFGPERCMMMKEGLKIPDLRIFYNSDIRFLEQF